MRAGILNSALMMSLALTLAGCSDSGNPSNDGPTPLDQSTISGESKPVTDGGKRDRGEDEEDSAPDKEDAGPPTNKVCKFFCDENWQCNYTVEGTWQCVGGRCVECVSDTDCAYGPKKCNTASGICRMCVSDTDCTGIGTGKCNPDGICTKCTGDADCQYKGSSTPYCQGGVCVKCKTDNDCASASYTGCDTATGSCTRCKKTSECCTKVPCGMVCDTGNGECQCKDDTACETEYYGLKMLVQCL